MKFIKTGLKAKGKKFFWPFFIIGVCFTISSFSFFKKKEDKAQTSLVLMKAKDQPGQVQLPLLHLIVETGFEDVLNLNYWIKECYNANSFKLSDSIARKGKYSARFELNKSDAAKNWTRSEIRLSPELESDRWYGMSNYLVGNYISDPEPELVAQWQSLPDEACGETWRSPSVSLVIKNDHFYIAIRWATNRVNTNETVSGEKFVDLGAVDKNKWIDWVFHINHSYSSDGKLEIWKNGKSIYQYNGPNWYNDETYPYFKVGIYKWPWGNKTAQSSALKRVVYVDEVRVGNKDSNLSEVSPH